MAGEEEEEPEVVDNRSLYEKLQAQKDEKQEEWEKAHQFKNQMDHWRLDEDDAAFEEERQRKIKAQQADSARLTEESAEFYKLARQTQERLLTEPPAKAAPGAWEGKRKQPASKPKLPAFKVLKQDGAAAPPAARAAAAASPTAAGATPAAHAPAAAATVPAGGGGLLGLGAYGSDDDDDDDET